MYKSLMATILLLIFSFFHLEAQSTNSYPTYFKYTPQQLQQVAVMNSDVYTNQGELLKWDHITNGLLEKNPIPDGSNTRIFAYLYTAQRDVAFLAYNTHGNFVVNLEPISYAVLKLFYPQSSVEIPESDPFSECVTQVVFQYIKERFNRENENIKNYQLNDHELTWDPGKQEPWGINIGSWQPWLIQSNREFRAPAPPKPDDPFWQMQCSLVKSAQLNLTENQKHAILYWAGETGPGSGDWFTIMNNYIFNHPTPLAKLLLVRSVFAQGYCDTMMSIFDSKYTYQVRRPAMVDTTILIAIKCPNHPSYPSGHSTTSGMAATLLSYYFPSETTYWYQLAEEAGYSRIWAGIHFPIDHQAGFHMGQKIAQSITQNPKNNL